MSSAVARRAIADALQVLSLREIVELCAEHADTQSEAELTGDKIARVRWASDHRTLTQMKEKLNH